MIALNMMINNKLLSFVLNLIQYVKFLVHPQLEISEVHLQCLRFFEFRLKPFLQFFFFDQLVFCVNLSCSEEMSWLELKVMLLSVIPSVYCSVDLPLFLLFENILDVLFNDCISI